MAAVSPYIRIVVIDRHGVVRVQLARPAGGQAKVPADAHADDVLLPTEQQGKAVPEVEQNQVLPDHQGRPRLHINHLTANGKAALMTVRTAGDPAIMIGTSADVPRLILTERAVTLLSTVIRSEHMGAEAVGQEEPAERSGITGLSKREHDIVVLVCQGLHNHAIGQRLGIAEPTVRRHLGMIFKKLDIDSRLELVVYACRRGLIPPEVPATSG